MRKARFISTGVFVWVCIFAVMFLCVGGVYGGTIFVADRGGHDVMAFDIDDTPTFTYSGSINFSNDIYGLGPIDMTIDEVHQIMFVSFETVSNLGDKVATCRIGLIDINTFEHIGDIVFSEADDFGGICYDAPRQKLYAVERDTNLVYVLRWHPETLSLEYEDVIELAQIRYACAIVVDGDMVYITEFKYRITSKYFKHIKQYDISNNWQYVQTIPNHKETTCLAYDAPQKIFYSGAYDRLGEFHHMIKHVMDPNEVIVKDIGGCMTDGDVDDYSGDVYITSYEGSGSSQYGVIELWDTSGWTSDPNQVIEPTAVYDVGLTPPDPNTVLYGPAGICYWYYDPRPVVIDVEKDDGLEVCVSPEDEITYTITVYPSGADHEWVRVVDYLPDGVTYEAGFWGYDPNTGFIPPDPNYTEEGNKYIWELGPLAATDDPVVLTLTVTVNGWAEPAGELINDVTVESDVGFGWTTEKTDVCCWGGDIIYVDDDAMGAETGVDWENAYTDLQDALERADKGCRYKIWVAKGTYKPGPRVTDSFEIPDNVEVYGGFCGDEPNTFDLDDRDIRRYETVLSGYIHTVYDSGGNPVITRNEAVVTMGDETILDGFTVAEGDLRGVEGDNVSFSISKSFIIDNDYDGISCKNGDVYIQWCEVKDNGRYGVYHDGSGYSLEIDNCKIHGNQQDGILIDSSDLKLISSIVYGNGQEGDYYGVNLLNPSSSPTIRNNTIVHNVNEGIKFTGSNNDPNVYNCILYYNNEEGDKMQTVGIDRTYHCCIYDPNDPEGVITTPDGDGNITCDPNFAYDYPVYGYYHLDFGSHCRDGGDSDQYPDEFDIDGQDRVFGYYVDIGADEATCEVVSNIADFTADGLVRLEDFYVLSAAYLSHDPNEPGLTDPNLSESWNAICNLDDTGNSAYTIDIDDFVLFCDEWLWVACWHESYEEIWMMSYGGGESLLLSESIAIQSETVPVEKSLEEQLADAAEIINWLEEVSKEKDFFDHIDKDAWFDFVDKIYDWLETLEFDEKSNEKL